MLFKCFSTCDPLNFFPVWFLAHRKSGWKHGAAVTTTQMGNTWLDSLLPVDTKWQVRNRFCGLYCVLSDGKPTQQEIQIKVIQTISHFARNFASTIENAFIKATVWTWSLEIAINSYRGKKKIFDLVRWQGLPYVKLWWFCCILL